MILHLSEFIANPNGNGAERRTAQILRIVNHYGVPITSSPNPIADHLYINPIKKLKTGWKHRQWAHETGSIWQRVKLLGYRLERIRHFFDTLGFSPSLIIWESSRRSDPLLPVVMAELNVPVLVLPHNLESLCYNQESLLSGRPQGAWLDEELALLKHCDEAISISREEQWLLNGVGIPTGFLPFFPAPEHTERFRAIRNLRKNRQSGNGLLCLGTADNKPTAAGMRLLMDLAGAGHLNNLIIAGFGTTKRLSDHPHFHHPSIRIAGQVSDEELDVLLAECRAVVLHQEVAAGALTKIPELLVAGVPIFANSTAARSWYGTPGLTIYQSLSEIPDLLTEEEIPFPEPQQPLREEETFIRTIQRMSGENLI